MKTAVHQTFRLHGDDRDVRRELPGGRLLFKWSFMARKVWGLLISSFSFRGKRQVSSQNLENSPEISALDDSDTQSPGRPTIGDNFLLGLRNDWATLLGQSWQEVGLALLSIRKQRSATINEVRKAFFPLKQFPNNGVASAYLRDLVEESDGDRIRKNRKLLDEIQKKVFGLQQKVSEELWKCREAGAALENQLGDLKETIESATINRYTQLFHVYKEQLETEAEKQSLEETLAKQEAYFSQSELLDFLHSERRSVEPLNIANALAGVPLMAWRQSFVRCSAMAYKTDLHLWYRIFLTIEQLWNSRPEEESSVPEQFFELGLRKLPQKGNYAREFLCKHWRDLRLAIEECSKQKLSNSEVPYAISRLLSSEFRFKKVPLKVSFPMRNRSRAKANAY